MNTLLLEILSSLIAVGLLSLFVGWAIRSVTANKELESTRAELKKKHAELQFKYDQDVEHLESQMSKLEKESIKLSTKNRTINESLRENEASVQKVRNDAIELNRSQAETQERLQRIIAEKDDELKLLRDGGAPALATAALASTANAEESNVASLSDKREAWEQERQRVLSSTSDEQMTVAIDPKDVPNDTFDNTVRIQDESHDDFANLTSTQTSQFDIEGDNTFSLDEDQTMVLGDSKLNKAELLNNSRDTLSSDDTLHITPKDSDS